MGGGAFSLMRLIRALLLLGVLAIVVAGCGGGGGPSAGSEDIAVVGPIHIKRARFDEWMGQAKRVAKSQGQTFPKAGSAEYAALKAHAVTVLVDQAEWEVRAAQMNIT